MRDDRPFGGRAPPAALYYASRDRRHEHPARHLHGLYVERGKDDAVTAFTEDGIENLKQIITDMRADGRAPPRKPSTE